LKEVWYKVSFCEYRQRQSCRAFTGLSICKNGSRDRGPRPLLRENFSETDQPSSKTSISKQYSLVAPQP